MSGFFFFFLFFFSRVFLSRKNCCSLFSFFFFSFFFPVGLSLFWWGEKKKRKNIYLERSARFRSEREREEYSHHHLRSRGTEGKETLAVITSSFSLFVVVVVRFAAGNVCHKFVTKKRVTEYFRDDQREKEVRKSEKEGGSWFSWNYPKKPKGRKKIQNTCLHRKLFIAHTRCCAYHQPAADQTYYRCLGASFILLFLLRWERAGAEKE